MTTLQKDSASCCLCLRRHAWVRVKEEGRMGGRNDGRRRAWWPNLCVWRVSAACHSVSTGAGAVILPRLRATGLCQRNTYLSVSLGFLRFTRRGAYLPGNWRALGIYLATRLYAPSRCFQRLLPRLILSTSLLPYLAPNMVDGGLNAVGRHGRNAPAWRLMDEHRALM